MSARVRAWFVHLYTGLGLVCAAGIALFIVRGDDASFRAAFLLMLVATVIDATDGYLARKADVKRVLPFFDGALLDNIIDFHTYTSLPLFLIWRADLLPGALAWVLVLPLLASAYGFSQVHAKTDEGFFLGFPSYWNIVAFYLYVLQPPVWLSLALIVTCAALTFVPTPYLYASRGGPFAKTINTGAVIWSALVVWMLVGGPAASKTVAVVSGIYPLTYLALSGIVARRTLGVRPSNA